MATRYWVGGSGTWDATTTTNWSATSGGGGGASAPTSADDVVFNSSSGAAPTVTMGTNAVCAAFTATAPTSGTLTLAFSTTGNLNFSGNWSNPSTLFAVTGAGGTGISYVGSASSTFTTNGISFPTTVIVNGTGTLTLGSAFTTTVSFTVTQGTFSTSTSNYALSTTVLSSSNSNVRTINLNASTVTLSAANALNFSTSTNLTFNAGTSTITISGVTPSINGGSGVTFSIVNFTSTAISTGTINGANTFTTLTITSKASDGISQINIGANQTVTGTLTLGAANTAVRRIFVASNTIGTARTLTVATIATLSDVDFCDITAAGASGTWSGTRLGNAQGNTNITFVAGKTVYWNLAGAQNWSATGWATSSGGTPAANNFPLAQDTAVFDNTGSVTGIISLGGGASWNIGTVDMSARTNAMSLSNNTDVVIYGSWKFGTGVTTSNVGSITFSGRTSTQQITSNGIAFPSTVTVDNVTGTVQLVDDCTLTNATKTFTLTSGTLDLNGKQLTTTLFSATGSTTRTIAFGSGNITCTGTGTVWTTATVTGLTVTGTPVVNVTSTGSTAITVSAGALSEANSISYNFTGGTYTLTFLTTAGYTARNVDFTGFSGTLLGNSTAIIYGNLKLSTGMTLTVSSSALRFGATSGTQTITSNTKTMDFPITINGDSATTVTFADALTLGSARALTFSLGTLQFAAGTTNTVGSFVTSGTTLKYLQSTTSGTQATLSDASGTNTATYLSIQDSNATGGATFTATDATNVNAGNNTGWSLPAILAKGSFLMFF
jgi:hypothetical protein